MFAPYHLLEPHQPLHASSVDTERCVRWHMLCTNLDKPGKHLRSHRTRGSFDPQSTSRSAESVWISWDYVVLF